MNYEIKLIRGTNLIAKDVTGTSDSFVKVFWVDKSGKVPKECESGKQATSPIITSLNPEWNWTAFSITSSDIATYHLKYIYFSVWDKDLRSEDFMGKTILTLKSIKSTPLGQSQLFDLPLLPRDGRKEKVKGNIVVQVTNLQCKTFFAKSDSSISRNNRLSVHSIGVRNTSSSEVLSTLIPNLSRFQFLPTFDYLTNDEEFSSLRALWFTSYAQLAYKNYPIAMNVLSNIWGMKKSKFFEHFETDTQGYGTYNDRIMILAFRGTESFADILTDLKFTPTCPFPQLKNLKVHRGFNHSYSTIRQQVEKFVKKALEENKDIKIYCCGHSLGGALATLCSAYLNIFENIKVSALYTIGQPKVGNRNFGEYFKEILPCFRIVNQTDPIPLLGYGSHFGREIYINTKGNLKEIVFQPSKFLDRAKGHLNAISNKELSRFLNNHTSGQYRKWIETYLQRDIAPNIQRDYVYINSSECHERINKITEGIKRCRHFRSFFGPMPSDLLQLKRYLKENIDVDLSSKLDLSQQTKIESLIASLSMNLELLSIKVNEYAIKSTSLSPIDTHVEFASFLNKFTLGIKFLVTSLVKKIPPKISIDLSFTNLASIYKHFISGDIYRYIFFLENLSLLIDEKKYEIAKEKISKMETERPPIGEFDSLLDLYTASIYFALGDIDISTAHLSRVVTSPAVGEIVSKIKRSKFRISEMEKHPITRPLILQMKSTVRQFRENKKKLSKEEIEKLTRLFDAADDNGDGYLTASELEQYIAQVGIFNILAAIGTRLHSNPELHFQSMVDNIKTRSHQRVGLDEFLSIMSVILQLDSVGDETNDINSNIE